MELVINTHSKQLSHNVIINLTQDDESASGSLNMYAHSFNKYNIALAGIYNEASVVFIINILTMSVLIISAGASNIKHGNIRDDILINCGVFRLQ